MALVDSENEKLARAAVIALSQTSDSRIRDKALDLLNRKQSQHGLKQCVDLLQNSLQPEDIETIEQAFFSGRFFQHLDKQQKERELHSCTISLRSMVKHFPDKRWTPLLLWFYEHGPCSFCRTNIVKLLISLNSATPELLEECRDDCCEKTRELVGVKESESEL